MISLEAAGETFVKHDEFRNIGIGSGVLRPIRGNLAREPGSLGKDRTLMRFMLYGRFPAPQVYRLLEMGLVRLLRPTSTV